MDYISYFKKLTDKELADYYRYNDFIMQEYDAYRCEVIYRFRAKFGTSKKVFRPVI